MEEAREGLDEAFEAIEYIHRMHKYFGLSFEDSVPVKSVNMSSVPTSISLLCYILGYVQFA